MLFKDASMLCGFELSITPQYYGVIFIVPYSTFKKMIVNGLNSYITLHIHNR